MIDYNGRTFSAVTPEAEGEVPVAHYHQDGNLLWGEFGGGQVRRGSLAGTCGPDGVLCFSYSMVLANGDVISGRSLSTPQRLADGRVRLNEEWERYGPHAAAGVSAIEEVPDIPETSPAGPAAGHDDSGR